MGKFRQSLFNEYVECPMRAYFTINNTAKDYTSLTMVVGSAIHEAIHRYHMGLCTADMMEDVAQRYIIEEQKKTPLQISENAKEKMSKFRVIFENYVRDSRQVRIIGSEIPFILSLDNFEFTGIIDQIREYPDGKIALLDLKSDEKEPTKRYIDTCIQFSLYAIAMREGLLEFPDGKRVLGKVPDVIIWYHLMNLVPYKKAITVRGAKYVAGDMKPRELQTSRSESDLRTAKQEVLNMAKAIQDGLFWRVARKNTDPCFLCYYAQSCSVFSV